MPIGKGYVGYRKVKFLRDKEYSGAAVRASLVSGDQIIGKVYLYILIYGTMRMLSITK